MILAEEMAHTRALRYSRWERMHYTLFRRWPESVVRRRIAAADLDELERNRRGRR